MSSRHFNIAPPSLICYHLGDEYFIFWILEAIDVNCPTCGFSNSPTANFCLKCKTPLAPLVSDLNKRLVDLNLVRPSSGLTSSGADEPQLEQRIAASPLSGTAAGMAQEKTKVPMPALVAAEAGGSCGIANLCAPDRKEMLLASRLTFLRLPHIIL